MASIVKRKKKFAVVYNYTDDNGVRRQKWETYSTLAEAKKRKNEVEYQQDQGTFVVPTCKTLDELLEEYVQIYGVNTWALSTYESRKSLIANYISSIIGDMKLVDITPRVMDKYYRDLLKVKSVATKYHNARSEYVTPNRVREIHKLLSTAFSQAVKWELIPRNPVENATLPKEEKKERDIWDADTLIRALEACDDDMLKLAINLAFSCSLRMGKMLGLTWDCVDITPVSIEQGKAYIYVNKELQKANREAMESLNDKDVLFKFSPVIKATNTRLLLKTPKTKTSVRKVFLPKTVAEMLVKHKSEQDELKELFGCEYYDYGLVFATSNGRPVEGQIINRAFSQLIRDNGLPKVVFHSLRHLSITYKLKMNGGDMKAVQGDSGHAKMSMIANVYSHIIDDDRRVNAQRLEDTFYATQAANAVSAKEEATEDTPDAATEATNAEAPSGTDEELFKKLLANPEMAALIKALAKNL